MCMKKPHSKCKVKGSDLHEGKNEADGEVWQPVEATSNSVGSRSVRLLEELCSDEERHPGCEEEPKNTFVSI